MSTYTALDNAMATADICAKDNVMLHKDAMKFMLDRHKQLSPAQADALLTGAIHRLLMVEGLME